LEYDRGTERPAHHLAKLDAYYAYRDTGRYARDYDGFPTILVVASDTDAEQRIATVAASSAVGRRAPCPRCSPANGATGGTDSGSLTPRGYSVRSGGHQRARTAGAAGPGAGDVPQ
jgi:hypothetical protein